MNKELTVQERDYCRLLVSGETQANAYRQAFGRSDLSIGAARKAGLRLSRKSHIVSELSHLRDAVGQAPALRADLPAILGKQELMARVLARAENAERDADALRGYEIYAKLAGYATPEVSTQVNVVQCSFASIMAAIQQSPQSP